MMCCICRHATAAFGVLCTACREPLMGPVGITHEQIVTHGRPTAGAGLVDVWGGVHRLATHMLIGRVAESPSLSILVPSVSRRHARIDLVEGRWLITDLRSANHTYVDDREARQPLALRTGRRVRIGYIGFYFVEDATALPTTDPFSAQTVIPDRAAIRLHQPTGGGGGVLEIEGKHVQLSLTQFELISCLHERMLRNTSEAPDVRGFVPLADLAATLSLDSSKPREESVRQVVSRLRRACIKAGIGNLIESRYGLGYRLAVDRNGRVIVR